MDHEVQLISDGEGLAVIGQPADVERFLTSEGLTSKDLGLPRLKSVLHSGSVVAQAGSQIVANTGRWVQLTPQSAAKVAEYGLRQTPKGLSTGVVRGPHGQIRNIVQFSKGPVSPQALVANPAVLAGAAGIMAQLAMKQTMDEITDYLAAIDAKVDAVLRAQNDAVLARMIGAGLVIDETMTIREQRGRVDDIMWSKVQTAPTTIADTQAYALLQLDALADRLESKTYINELAATAKEAETVVREWLAVLARTFQLQDAIAVLELDRVLDESPDELDGHRLGLKIARQKRLTHISDSTERLLSRINAAVETANANVLMNPFDTPAVVRSSNHVLAGVHDFRRALSIESSHEASEARAWTDAATDVKDKALGAGAHGVSAARNLGSEAISRAGSVTGRISSGIPWKGRRRNDG
ncbi:hypothetical protein Kisp01_67450 [Kineosporia sp. NBRC 101677]|uniref:hypothetical protein n=1 Tax=Kineosporia sp. NBRC 101677 TaxID=3032197 RepID=UPI0024A07196|nr:hypothetical protein [Kineosporia sp. NBRC 101677]GLY19731.1 hypothetical protein Kisp01_67450 [Kineosporia sp. NBRC 101677]